MSDITGISEVQRMGPGPPGVTQNALCLKQPWMSDCLKKKKKKKDA